VKAAANELPETKNDQADGGFVRDSTSLFTHKWATLLIVAFAVFLITPIAIWGIPEGGDLANHYRFALPFYESIRAGDIYPGWLSESNAGYGDARFRFYPPAFYYLLAAFKPLLGWFGSSVMSFMVLSAIGCFGVYFWTRSFLHPQFAGLAGVFYAVAPYHLNELYQASLLSEYAGSAVLPFVFAFIDRICERRRVLDVAGLGAAYALLISTNLPLAVIGSLSALVFSLVRAAGKGSLPIALRLVAGVLLGLAGSAFFWVRMVSELPWIKGSRLDPRAYYDYRLNFIFSPDALTNRNTWYANLLALATIGFLLPAIVLIRKGHGRRYLAIVIVTLFSFSMSLPLSKPLWAVIPKLSEVQFPWRWLAITSLTGSALLAWSLPRWLELLRTRIRPLYFLPVLGFVLSLIFIATQIVWDSDYMPRREFDSFLPTIRGAVSFKDWLPVDARELTELPKMAANVELASRQVTLEGWEPEFRKFRVGVGPTAEARVKTFYYPNWTASADGIALRIRPSQEGVMLVEIPNGEKTVEIIFRESLKVRVATFVSGATWILIFLIVAYPVIRRNKATQSPRPE
jgi:6-pyruvoyl-tetrahydropterin synthase related domain